MSTTSRCSNISLKLAAYSSIFYAAPELANGAYADEKSDIYSLGAVLYEMLSGEVPFNAENAVSVALMQLHTDAKKLTDINPDIPHGLEQICERAMQKKPEDRYMTVGGMLAGINKLIQNPNNTFDDNNNGISRKEKSIKPVEKRLSLFRRKKQVTPKTPVDDDRYKPYEGRKKYIFISYSHKNEKEVMQIVRRLQDSGYRVWYDRDNAIKPAAEYNDFIAKCLLGGEVIIAFITPEYMASPYCQDELIHARDRNKTILMAYLKKSTLPPGMEMRFGRIQYVKKHECASAEEFFQKLLLTKGLESCK